jgi:hypothetical protein
MSESLNITLTRHDDGTVTLTPLGTNAPVHNCSGNHTLTLAQQDFIRRAVQYTYNQDEDLEAAPPSIIGNIVAERQAEMEEAKRRAFLRGERPQPIN